MFPSLLCVDWRHVGAREGVGRGRVGEGSSGQAEDGFLYQNKKK